MVRAIATSPASAKRKRPSVVGFRLAAETRAMLDDMAARAGQSPTQFVDGLIRRAFSDPDGYYLRVSAVQSHMAAAAALAVLDYVTEHDPALVERRRIALHDIARDSMGMFGPMPKPPSGAQGPEHRNEAALALADAYGFPNPWSSSDR